MSDQMDSTPPNQLYPNTWQFFGGYFFMYWHKYYKFASSMSEEDKFRCIVRLYVSEGSYDKVLPTIREIEDLISLNLSEGQLTDMITQSLSANVNPPAFDMTYQEWLELILETLKSPGDEDTKDCGRPKLAPQ